MALSPAYPVAGFRFGSFELDLTSGELRKQGVKIRLQEKPLRALTFLLEHAGEIVTREQLREQLWPADIFVDFDDNLNTTIKRVRDALGDTSESPRFVETIPRRGYRFIPPVQVIPSPGNLPAASVPSVVPPRAPRRSRWRIWAFIGAGLLLALAAVAQIWRTTHTQAQPNDRIMLAVLPFRNLSGDRAQDYISEGVTEELIAHLGRLSPRYLGVISRSSVMRFSNAPLDATAIGRELSVAYLLEGSVSRIDGRLQVTAQLIQTGDRTHVWAETFERPSSDLLAIESEVARRVAEAVSIRFMPSQQTVLARAATTNTGAYDAYLAGLYEANRGTRDSFEAALGHFRRAIALDPAFALAHDGVARTYINLAGYHFIPANEAYKQAREHVDSALRINEGLAESRAVEAALLQRESPGAPGIEAAYRKVIGLNPSDARSRHDYGLYLLDHNRGNEAITEISEALRLDPLSPAMLCDRAWILFKMSRVSEAQTALKRALELDPNFPYALYLQGMLDIHAGRLQDAIAIYRRAVDSSGRTPKYLHALADVYITASRNQEARKLLEELKEQAKTSYVPPEYLEDLTARL